MPSEEYVASVEDLIARHVASDTAHQVLPEAQWGTVEAERVRRLVEQAIAGAFELARRQLNEARMGRMSFEEAMEAIKVGKMVTRPGWGLLRALTDGFDQNAVTELELDNLDGFPSGPGGGVFQPTVEERNATDWMEYQKPRFVELHDLEE